MGEAKNNTAKWVWLTGRHNRIAYIIVGLFFVALPLFMPPYLQGVMTKALIFGIFAMSLNLLVGYAGLFSLGHAAYFGVAAYTSSILTVRYGVESFWLAAPAGILMAVLVAGAFGFIALRLSGVYFLLVTLALGQLLYSVALKWQTVTGGTNGLINVGYPDLGLPGFTMNAMSFYYLVFAVLVISLFLLYRLIESPFGVALQGVRDSETRMRSLGYNTWLYKYIAFVVAGLFAGVAGVLFRHYSTVLVPTDIGVLASTLVLLMVIIGGDRVFWGPVAGAILITFIVHYSSIYTPERWPLILGGLFVLAVMFLRGGISIYLVKLWKRLEYHYGSIKS